MTKPPIPPVSTEPDAELQRFLIAQINGWKMSEHAPERLARVVEIAVRQQVRAEVATSLSSPTAHCGCLVNVPVSGTFTTACEQGAPCGSRPSPPDSPAHYTPPTPTQGDK